MLQCRNNVKSILSFSLFVLILLLSLFSPLLSVDASAASVPHTDIGLDGSGTREAPFLIRDMEDLRAFRDAVNNGEGFEGVYFRQTENIDMKKERWVPIGTLDDPFCGIYDGAGHYVENLYIPRSTGGDYSGFFGVLSGIVANFGVESGIILGIQCGSIASVSSSNSAALLNCYSKADIKGKNAGGMADSFPKNGNVIACCWFDGSIKDSHSGILSFGGECKIYHDYTTTGVISHGSNVKSATSATIPKDFLYSEDFLTNLNLSVAFTQCLFANGRGVDLVQWELSDEGNIVVSSSRSYLNLLEFINLYLLPLILILIIFVYAILFALTEKGMIWKKWHKDIVAVAVISGVVSFFVDTALLSKGLGILNLGNGTFILLINALFLTALGMILKNRAIRIRLSKEHLPLVVAIALVCIAALTQFDVVPKFDAGIYYGSLVQSVNLFQLDLLTYVGAFVCWKWAQGLVLLIAPFEFLFNGQAFGVYISNLIILIVTMVCVWHLLRQIGPKVTPTLAALGAMILVLCPYQLGLFSYLCMDTHTAYFLIWMIASYKKKNHLLVAFCGYLLAFNKITGLIFYVFFLITVGIWEMLQSQGENVWKKILSWWNWKQVLLWIAPAVLYLASTVVAEDVTVLNFYGSYTEATIGLKSLRGLANNFMQSFVFGFRWIFVIAFVLGVIALCKDKSKIRKTMTDEGFKILVGAMVACLSVLAVLCLYRGDAECPRYTAMFNVFYALSFPILVQVLLDKKLWHYVLTGGVTLLLAVQLFCTIDPSILITCDYIKSGKRNIYKLAFPGDFRGGMALGADYGRGYEVYGDLYTYNFEHNFYDSLLDQMLTEIDPKEDTQFVLLDVIYYETHMTGNRYDIYWNTRTKNRTYDGSDPDSIFLYNNTYASTELLKTGMFELEDTFHLVVPARVDERDALEVIKDLGYDLTGTMTPENLFGSMRVYSFAIKE